MRPVIIVSGASSSLGSTLCRGLIEAGYKVYAGYHLHRGNLPKSKYLVPLKLNITERLSCQRAVQSVIKREKKFFGLINLVAINPSGDTVTFSDSDFQNILDVNAVGPFRLIQAALPHLPVSGRIINVGSLSGLISFPGFSLYSASKFALRALSLSLYFEWLPQKKYIVHIAPGAIAKYPPVPAPVGSARNRIPLLNWLLPLVTANHVSRVIIGTLKNPVPPPEILLGVDTFVLTLVRRLIPDFFWTQIQKIVWQKQR